MKILKGSLWIIGIIGLVLILQYFFLIPISFNSFMFWIVLGCALTAVAFTVCIILNEGLDTYTISFKIVIGILLASIFLPIIIALFGMPIFRADSYKEIATIEEGNFNDNIPSALDADIMDIQTAINIGSRAMGEIDDVSQYVISDEYNMIVYKDKTYRVSPLEYADEFRALGNKGISGYILVDCNTQEAKLVQLDEKIKYSPSAVFNYDLERHIRFNYPSALLGKEQFEIDDEGTPYYIVPTYKTTIGLFSGKVLDKILIINAINGNIEEYTINELPSWVDHSDSVSHMMENANYTYKYVNGYFNSVFSKKDVKSLSYSYDSVGYSSIRTDKGIEYFTGVTSVNNDESILGFLFLNPKTGKITFYNCVGAEESSAKSSAEALVQNYGYIASYPFIVNVDGIETYLIALKDKTGTNKAFSFVNVKNYTIAVQASTKEEALKLYKQALVNKDSINSSQENKEITAKITQIYTAVENSTTYFYYKLEGYNELFVSSILNNRNQVLLKVGDEVRVISDYTDNYHLVNSINF